MIWGAGGGIGRALLDLLHDENYTTIAVARDAAALPATHTIDADVSDPYAVEQAAYSAGMEVEAVDLWVYAVGDILSAKVEAMTPAEWDRIVSANLSGAFLAAHYSLPLLAPEAHLVFLGAVSERLRLPGLSAYAAAKAGLEAFVTAFSKEDRKRRMTIVRPGAVDTPLWDKVPLRLPADAPPPEKVARRILDAHTEGHKGTLDLV